MRHWMRLVLIRYRISGFFSSLLRLGFGEPFTRELRRSLDELRRGTNSCSGCFYRHDELWPQPLRLYVKLLPSTQSIDSNIYACSIGCSGAVFLYRSVHG